ncbi:testicular haploid expressed gene protein-like [Leptopilina heterotoma]|uniref:testicular haploid expressed gene protein-like n=1 Tax=Leptopilina heterotoma TaxID=63436 RepID=UPI001CA830EE|nr:testicular haploid expressed gene protein-like [Leptopilina heterotoma]
MVSKRVRYARAHFSRRKHIALLARPLKVHLYKDINILENPFTVSRAALKFRPTKRLKILAKPKSINKKYDSAMKAPIYSKVPQAALNAKASNRIKDLSLPPKSAVNHIRKVFSQNKTKMEYINKISLEIRKSRYQKYRLICNTLHQQAFAREYAEFPVRFRSTALLHSFCQGTFAWRKKLKRFLEKPSDWERHNKVLERLAKPKRKHFPPKLSPLRKSKKKRKYNPTRVEKLAQPLTREAPSKKNAFKVKSGALKYEMTDKMKELAYRIYPRICIEPRIPGKVTISALKYEANDRIQQLARPPNRPPGRETDLKDNAFDVSPTALKAWCSPAIKKLAKPRIHAFNRQCPIEIDESGTLQSNETNMGKFNYDLVKSRWGLGLIKTANESRPPTMREKSSPTNTLGQHAIDVVDVEFNFPWTNVEII